MNVSVQKSFQYDVSVIIVNYNTCDLTLQAIKSIYNYTQNLSFEIILVDNASTDNTIAKVTVQYPTIKIIANNENIGFGRANNLGINISTGKYVFLLNSDAYLISNALLEFKNYMDLEENRNVGICGGELITGTNIKTVSFGNFPSLKELILYNGLHLLFKSYYRKHVSSGVVNYDERIKTVDYITGADLFIRKNILYEIGVFDDDFFMYFEETELSYRAKRIGYSSKLLPYIKIIHLDGASTKNALQNTSFNFYKYAIFNKSRFLYFRKCKGKLYSAVAKIFLSINEILYTLIRKNKGNLFKKLYIIFHS